jgi:hypothetical protein
VIGRLQEIPEKRTFRPSGQGRGEESQRKQKNFHGRNVVEWFMSVWREIAHRFGRNSARNSLESGL